MGLVNNIFVDDGCSIPSILSDRAKGKYLQQLSLPMRNSIGLSYPMCSSIGMNIEQDNKSNSNKYLHYQPPIPTEKL